MTAPVSNDAPDPDMRCPQCGTVQLALMAALERERVLQEWVRTADQAQTTLLANAEAAESALAALRADAERYKYLREHGCGYEWDDQDIWLGDKALDAAIDAAIAKGGAVPQEEK